MLNPREKIEEKVTDWLLLLSMLKCRVAQGEKLGHTTTAPRHHHHDLNVECVCVQLNRSVINSPFLSLSLCEPKLSTFESCNKLPTFRPKGSRRGVENELNDRLSSLIDSLSTLFQRSAELSLSSEKLTLI